MRFLATLLVLSPLAEAADVPIPSSQIRRVDVSSTSDYQHRKEAVFRVRHLTDQRNWSAWGSDSGDTDDTAETGDTGETETTGDTGETGDPTETDTPPGDSGDGDPAGCGGCTGGGCGGCGGGAPGMAWILALVPLIWRRRTA